MSNVSMPEVFIFIIKLMDMGQILIRKMCPHFLHRFQFQRLSILANIDTRSMFNDGLRRNNV